MSFITAHRKQLDALASTLLTNEVLEREDIDAIMGGVPSAAPPRVPGKTALGIAAASPGDPAEQPE